MVECKMSKMSSQPLCVLCVFCAAHLSENGKIYKIQIDIYIWIHVSLSLSQAVSRYFLTYSRIEWYALRFVNAECVPFSSSGPYHMNYTSLTQIKVTFWQQNVTTKFYCIRIFGSHYSEIARVDWWISWSHLIELSHCSYQRVLNFRMGGKVYKR